jgi:hypothetical protein
VAYAQQGRLDGTDDRLDIRWQLQPDGWLRFNVTLQAQAWIGVGLAPMVNSRRSVSSTNRMIDSDVVVYRPQTDIIAEYTPKGLDQSRILQDEIQNIRILSKLQTEAQTMFAFERPLLKWNDPEDVNVTDGSNIVIWAYGRSNSFRYHSSVRRGWTNVEIGWNTCASKSCGVHGRCEGVGNYAQCRCDSGYTGDECSICKDNRFRFADECIASSVCNERVCNRNGLCRMQGSLLVCDCNSGYEATLNCSSCASGFKPSIDAYSVQVCEPISESNPVSISPGQPEVSLSYEMEGMDRVILKLWVPNVQNWIGVAIANAVGDMIGSDSIIIFPAIKQAYRYDIAGKNVEQLVRSKLHDEDRVRWQRNRNGTLIEYNRPLIRTSGQVGRSIMLNGAKTKVLWAIGQSHELGPHLSVDRGMIDLEIQEPSSSMNSTHLSMYTLWHGIIMFIACGILIPYSILRRLSLFNNTPFQRDGAAELNMMTQTLPPTIGLLMALGACLLRGSKADARIQLHFNSFHAIVGILALVVQALIIPISYAIYLLVFRSVTVPKIRLRIVMRIIYQGSFIMSWPLGLIACYTGSARLPRTQMIFDIILNVSTVIFVILILLYSRRILQRNKNTIDQSAATWT